MSQTTSGLGLTLPDLTDPADITIINQNLQILENKILDLEGKVSLNLYVVSQTNISDESRVIYDAGITDSMVCANVSLSNPLAQIENWTIETRNGVAIISGGIEGTTDITLYFQVSHH